MQNRSFEEARKEKPQKKQRMTEETTDSWVYVLLLKHGKYYIGQTNDIEARLQEHKRGSGSEWTRMYPMIRVINCEKGGRIEELQTTLNFMREKGWENVRGASFCEVEMNGPPPELEEDIQTEVTTAHLKNQCYKCYRSDHYAAECFYEFSPSSGCVRCGHKSHKLKNGCYAKWDVNGMRLPKCVRCGRETHNESDCMETEDDI